MDNGEAIRNLLFVAGILVLIGFAWLLTGGPSRIPYNASIFLNKPTQNVSEHTQKNVKEISEKSGDATIINKEESGLSPYENLISLRASHVKGNDANSEYVTLIASSRVENPINITGWTLKNSSGNTASIGEGDYLPIPGREPVYKEILIRARERAIITTGRNPIGVSFRTNRCTGYFTQSIDFEPNLPRQCPYLRDEAMPRNLGDNCLDFIDKVGRCTVPNNTDFEGNFIEPRCREFIMQNTGYNACVNLHKGDDNFEGSEWRIFLNKGFEMYKSRRETITLLDNSGLVVDSVSY